MNKKLFLSLHIFILLILFSPVGLVFAHDQDTTIEVKDTVENAQFGKNKMPVGRPQIDPGRNSDVNGSRGEGERFGNLNREGSAKLQERLDEQKKKKDEVIATRCEKITKQIDDRVTKFENNKPKHVEFYQKVVTNLNNLITTLKAKGIDTANLSSHVAVLNDKVTKFSTDFNTYVTKLNATKGFACGTSQGDFQAALKDARDSLKIVKDDVVDIRNYYLTVVKKDIIEIRAEIKAKRVERTENTNTNGSGEQE